jgi:hypothetical protein
MYPIYQKPERQVHGWSFILVTATVRDSSDSLTVAFDAGTYECDDYLVRFGVS